MQLITLNSGTNIFCFLPLKNKNCIKISATLANILFPPFFFSFCASIFSCMLLLLRRNCYTGSISHCVFIHVSPQDNSHVTLHYQQKVQLDQQQERYPSLYFLIIFQAKSYRATLLSSDTLATLLPSALHATPHT